MVKQSIERFKKHLGEQINFLQKSCKEYDNGDFSEAKRISVVLRNLLHDTKNSTSLLTHLSRKNIKFYDTSIDYPRTNIAPEYCLTGFKIEFDPNKPTRVTFEPPLGNGSDNRYIKGKVSFGTWWNHQIIDDKTGNKLTRRELILAVCNQDGGAHIDSKLKNAYANSMANMPVRPLKHGVEFFPIGNDTDSGEGIIVSDIISAAVRQIAYEVLESLKDEFPIYFNDTN